MAWSELAGNARMQLEALLLAAEHRNVLRASRHLAHVRLLQHRDVMMCDNWNYRRQIAPRRQLKWTPLCDNGF